jgi:folate-binding protein YgfZ
MELLADGPCVRDAAPYGLVRVTGRDAGDFLQRLCSQDVLALVSGQLAPAAFLDGRGKLAVTCLAARLGPDFVLETQLHQQPRLLELLDRFHFTEQLEFAAVPQACRERIGAAAGDGRAAAAQQGPVTALSWARRCVQFERWYAQDPSALPADAGRDLGPDLAECLRMGAGIVMVGVETEPSTLALEADLDDHCSLTKGCYTGQEIIARIHTYGHTNRALCLLQLAPGAPIAAPQTLHEPDDGVAVGRVMHAVAVPGRESRRGLGYLPKDFQPVGTKLALADGSAVEVVGFCG